MTVASSTDRATFPGNDATTVFPLPFRFFANSDIQAWLVTTATGVLTPLTLGVHYTLIGAGDPEVAGSATSELTMITPPTSAQSLFVLRVIPVTQPTDIVNQGRFFPETHETVFDRLTMLIQQNAGAINRVIRVQDFDPEPAKLPSAAQRAMKIMSFDADGNPVAIDAASDSALVLRQDLASATDPAKGDKLVAYIQAGLNATARTVHDKFLDFAVSLDDFYQESDGNDYTPAAIRANAASLAIQFPPRTIHLQNWEPLAGTVIYAWGSRVNRLNDTLYSTTAAAGAILANAPGLVIFGGEWGLGTGSTALVWTGSILLQSGSLRVVNAKFVETWGGINGAENQNGALDMTNLTIQGCEFDGCAHNTYIADCQTFNYVGNESKNSNRDGLRLYRNVQNFLIVGNHIHDNGDGTPAQSQDAIDIFYGGAYGIISGNFLYNNVSQGIDIKRSPVPVGETSFSNYVIVTNNHIYGNGFSGVSLFMGLDPVEYNLSYNISNNHIHDNQSYGVIGLYCRDLDLSHNHVYNNGLSGVRLENSVDYSVAYNHVYNNGLLLSGGLRMGIHCLSTNVNGRVTGNDVHPGGLTNQVDGIWFFGTGSCRNNNSRDHSSLNYNCDANITQTGKTYSTKIGNNTNTQLLAIASKGCFAGARIAVNNTLIADVLVQKRNATTGGSATTLATQAALNNPTSYTSATVASAATAATRNVAGGEMLTTTLLNITSAFTDGILEVHYIN